MSKYHFTDRWLRSPAPTPTAGRVEFVDALCPGLHLRVTIQGTRTFSAMFRVNGKLIRQTIGRYPRVSLSNARAAALDMMRTAQDGADARERRSRAPCTVTYEELVEAYTEKHLKVNARSWRNIRSGLLNKRMTPFLKRPVATITRREIIDLCDTMVAAGTPQGAVNHLRYLKMLFNWAAGRDMIVHNVTSGVKPPAKSVERDRVLSDAEIAAVWKATFSLPTPYSEMYRMFLLTGQRRSEVATMRWSEVAGDVWTIPREKVKKDRAHTVPLSRTAQAVLQSLNGLPRFADDGFVFSTTGGRSASSNFCKVKRELDRLSGVTDWTIHDIRRTVRSKLAELGVPREVARKVLNHEDGKVDRIYNRHEYLLEKREALEKWERMLISISAAKNQTLA
ncbi:MAG: tyrosine-type recombinase/integrase [Sphingomonas sp.]|nr:tyrosine-type recombinase/integrase [Sphingomonas sp.]